MAGFVENVNKVATDLTAGLVEDIVLLADISASINTVADNTDEMAAVIANEANINTIAGSIGNVNNVGGSISNVNTTATNIASVNTVSTNVANVNTTATNIADINSVATTVVPNIVEILLADDNAVIATTQAGIATTKAGEASDDADQTALDRIATAADKVATNADVVLTHADVVTTGTNVGLTNADVILTHADVVLTHADAAQTALDVIATNADVVSTNADAIATAADRVQTGIDANTTITKAGEANASAISANTSANTATTKAGEASTSASTANSAANRAEAVVIPTAATYSYTQQDWRQSMMSKAEFNALAAETRRNNAGSGFIEWGKHLGGVNINEGMWVYPSYSNYFILGKEVTGAGVSKTGHPEVNINDISVKVSQQVLGSTTPYSISLPPAPTILPSTATLTQEQIDSGVIKHADASNSGLIVNGKFDTDTSGWTEVGASVSAGAMILTNPTSAEAYAYQAFTTVIGKKYTCEVEITIGTSGTSKIQAKTSFAGSIIAANTYTTSGRITFDFIATSISSIIVISNNNTTTGNTNTFDNVTVFPVDAISRTDLAFLETWHEDVSEKDFVYPLGCTQNLTTTGDCGNTVVGAFAGAATYSLFSDTWQADSAFVGKGYVWSTLSEANRKLFVSNPENNCYLDGDKVYQAQYGAKVEMMKGDSFTEATAFTALGYTVDTVDKGLYKHSDGSEAIGIALVHRRNQGMYHPVYNSNGSKLASDGLPWYSTTVSFTCTADCFTDTKLQTASGYIGTTSGRADGLFYNQIAEMDVTDLRNSAKKIEDYTRTMERYFAKVVAGTYRGKEGEVFTEVCTQTTTGTVATVQVKDGTKYKAGSVIQIYDLIANVAKGRFMVFSISGNTLTVDRTMSKSANSYMISGGNTTRTKSNNMTISDVIGNPTNYPTTWKQNEVGTISLHTAEDGTTSLLPTGTTGSDGLAIFKLSRKANATPLQVLKSTDSGVTWTALTVTTHYTFSTITNAITFTAGNIPLTTDLIMVTYQTHTNMAESVVQAEVLAIGNVRGLSLYNYSHLLYNLIGKIASNGGGSTGQIVTWQVPLTSYDTSLAINILLAANGYTLAPTHLPPATEISNALATVYPKFFPYLTRANGKAYLNIVFKEMKHNGTSWGDDAKFNIVDNISTTTDNNAQTVLIGTKRVELPYFIGADE